LIGVRSQRIDSRIGLCVWRAAVTCSRRKSWATIQIIDVRDLSDFTMELIEENASGVYNVTGPDYELTLGRLLDISKQVSGSDANFRWASVDFVRTRQAWSDMPTWIPDDEEGVGLAYRRLKAIAAGGFRRWKTVRYWNGRTRVQPIMSGGRTHAKETGTWF
jgi:nucleoside-diphosphate-sugar epimerase